MAGVQRDTDIHASVELQKHLCFQKDGTRWNSKLILFSGSLVPGDGLACLQWDAVATQHHIHTDCISGNVKLWISENEL